MKTRILSAIAGIAIAVVIFTLNLTSAPWLLNAAIAVIACVSLHEILVATGFMENKAIVLLCYALTVFLLAVPYFFAQIMWGKMIAAACAVYFFLMFVVLLAGHMTIKVERVALAIMITAMVALPYYSMLYMYWANRFDTGKYKMVGQSLVILCFLVSWMTDTAAYFTGRWFGKHKLAPIVSPKKTVEGAIGGFIGCIGLVSGIVWLATGPLDLVPFDVNWICLIVATAVGSLVSMVGDLSFSIIKRAFNIKDFGKIMPGHGGVLDRFDSVLFVCPVLCMINMWCPIIVVV